MSYEVRSRAGELVCYAVDSIERALEFLTICRAAGIDCVIWPVEV